MKSLAKDYWRALAVTLAALFMIGSGALPQIADWGVPVGEQSDRLRTLLVPPGWAFSIWGIIFLGSLTFALSGFVPALARSALYRRIGWWAAALFVVTGAWQVWVPVQSIDLVSQAIILTCLTVSLVILWRVNAEGRLPLFQQIVVRATFGLFAGWLTAASFVGSGAVVLEAGWGDLFQPRSEIFALVMLGVIAVIGVLVTASFGGVFYATGAGWALAALMMRHFGSTESVPVGAAACIALAVVLIGLFWFWRRQSANPSMSET
jgi:hypothetical protein